MMKRLFSNERLWFGLGIAVAVFAVFSVIGVLSYLFTWRADQSLLNVPSYLLDVDMDVANYGGSLGFGWGHLLVGLCFGLGALAFCAALCALAVRMLRDRDVVWSRFAFITLYCPVTLSLFFAFIGGKLDMLGLDVVWGGGLGGAAGAFLVSALERLLGVWVTAIIIILMALTAFLSVRDMLRKVLTDVADTKAASTDENVVAPTLVSAPAVATVALPETAALAESEEPSAPSPLSYGNADGAEPDTPNFPLEGEPADNGDEGFETTVTSPEDVLSTEINEELPQLDIRSDVDRYTFPSLNLLLDYADKRFTIPEEEISRNVEKIKTTLASFRIPISSIKASVGYTVTLYSIELGDGVRVNSVRNLEDDIAIKIGIKGVRVVKLADSVGIEVPNDKPSVVPLKAILNSDAFRNSKGELPIALGYTITTKAKVFDLADAPHLLVAGATKQGKSVGLNAIISSLLFSKHPTELKFVFIDPKMVEFQKYSKLLKHYLALLPPLDNADEADSAIVKDPKNAEAVLRSLCVEMDDRYKLLSAAGVNKITDYNRKYSKRFLRPDEGHHFMPYLVVVVDEYADLTKASFGSDKNLSRSIENSINRLAAKGRAAGLHVIIATQRPSVDVITGTIKGNFPTRMAFRTAQRQDSQTILGMAGAEKLIGKGDMLFFTGADAERVQCALVDSDEIDELTEFIAAQQGYRQCCPQPYYLPDPGDTEGGAGGDSDAGLVDMKNLDPMFEEAAKLAVMNMSMSTSMLQRKLQLGFARAGRIMDQLEAAGVVGPQQGSRPREALVQDLASLQSILDAFIK